MPLTKEDFFKQLYSSQAMKTAFKQVKSQKEANQIKACVDEILGKFYESVFNAYVPVQNNSDLIKKMVEEEESSLISNEETIKVTKDK